MPSLCPVFFHRKKYRIHSFSHCPGLLPIELINTTNKSNLGRKDFLWLTCPDQSMSEQELRRNYAGTMYELRRNYAGTTQELHKIYIGITRELHRNYAGTM